MSTSPFISYGKTQWTYEFIRQDPCSLRNHIGYGAKVVLISPNPLEVFYAFSILDGWAQEIHFVPTDMISNQFLESEYEIFQKGELIDANVSISATSELRLPEFNTLNEIVTNWILYSSGTTGQPKAVSHTLSSLTQQIRDGKTDNKKLIWGLLYEPIRMAGVQVILNAYLRSETLMTCDTEDLLIDKFAFFANHGVTALSGTPTMFRILLQYQDLPKIDLVQITLGGEIADQKILDSLVKVFPKSRITHIYASTEIGFGFAVSDRRAGFPTEYLDSTKSKYRISIIEDELCILDGSRTDAKGPDYIHTGDIVELKEDRVLFRGRNSGVVNIAGAKVWPEEIENFMRTHSLIQEVVVFGARSSQSGQILSAKVVVSPGLTASEIRKWMRKHLPSYRVPAVIQLVDTLEITNNGKIGR